MIHTAYSPRHAVTTQSDPWAVQKFKTIEVNGVKVLGAPLESAPPQSSPLTEADKWMEAGRKALHQLDYHGASFCFIKAVELDPSKADQFLTKNTSANQFEGIEIPGLSGSQAYELLKATEQKDRAELVLNMLRASASGANAHRDDDIRTWPSTQPIFGIIARLKIKQRVDEAQALRDALNKATKVLGEKRFEEWSKTHALNAATQDQLSRLTRELELLSTEPQRR